jgi:hypothetical protein
LEEGSEQEDCNTPPVCFFGLRDELSFLTRAKAFGNEDIPKMEQDLFGFFQETCRHIDLLERDSELLPSIFDLAVQINRATRMANDARQNAERRAAVRLGRQPDAKKSFDELYRPPGGWAEFREEHWQRLLDARTRSSEKTLSC